MRPLWVEFPKAKETFTVDDEHMLGQCGVNCVENSVTQEYRLDKVCLTSGSSLGYAVKCGCMVYVSGPGLLVRPVTDAGATGVNVYLPGTDEVCKQSDILYLLTSNYTFNIKACLLLK